MFPIVPRALQSSTSYSGDLCDPSASEPPFQAQMALGPGLPGCPVPHSAPLPARQPESSGRGRPQHAGSSCRPGHAGARRPHSLSPGTGPGAGGPLGRPGRVARHRCGSAGSHHCVGGRLVRPVVRTAPQRLSWGGIRHLGDFRQVTLGVG